MAQPGQQQQRRRRRLLAALLVLLFLGGAASATSAVSSIDRKDGAAIATEKAAGQDQEAARAFWATTAEEDLPVRMEMEVDVQDYPPTNANARHEPGFPRPRGPEHP